MKKRGISNEEETIIGMIKEIDDHGNSGIAIFTDDDYYIVEMNAQGQRLLNEIESRVETTGSITTDPDGTNRMIVSDFEVFEPKDDLVVDHDYFFDDDYADDEDNW